MKSLASLMADLTEEEIERAYLEYKEWVRTGTLEDGVLRGVHGLFMRENNIDYFPIHAINEPLLFELVQRYRVALKKEERT